jgi:hypothetical protein
MEFTHMTEYLDKRASKEDGALETTKKDEIDWGASGLLLDDLNAPELEITDEMVAVGLATFEKWKFADPSEHVVFSVYRDMERARRKSHGNLEAS